MSRFSVMVMRAKMPRPSGTITRPWRARSHAPRPRMDTPCSRMSPEPAGSKPVSAFSVVVLPAPLAPIRLTSSPARTSKLMPLTARMPP